MSRDHGRPDIHKVGLLTLRNDAVLLCRKRHTTSKLILPGGKVEPGESLRGCLERELREELGPVHATDLEAIGSYEHQAAHDDPRVNRVVRIDLFAGKLHGSPTPCAEIVELVWFSRHHDPGDLAPSLREAIFPDLVARSLVSWKRFA